ncbi:MAG: FAD-dependent oxidoreductase [Patescibacteria group bacterium]
MVSFIVKLIKKEEVAEDTMAFYFEKPDGFEFTAGQYITVTLFNPTEKDDEGSSRFFSLLTAPYENYLGVATRMRDTAFKRVLKNLPITSKMQITGPFGSFFLHKDTSKPAVFLIGGIGITPIFSIIKNTTRNKTPHKLFLFYSNKKPNSAPFLKELQELEKENSNFKLIATMTSPTQEWQGETGYINKEMIQKYVKDLGSPIYYMSGSPAMVKAMRELLGKTGVIDSNIKFEEFSGY